MLNSPSFIYLATILPPILLGIVIWKSDKFQEPGKFLVTAFLLGVAIDLPLHLLILLSDVYGLYDKDPKKSRKAKLIKEVKTIDKSIIKASSYTNNNFARGGMKTKIMAAKIATAAGCGMVIVNGNSKKIIKKIFEDDEGTYFHPKKRKKNN